MRAFSLGESQAKLMTSGVAKGKRTPKTPTAKKRRAAAGASAKAANDPAAWKLHRKGGVTLIMAPPLARLDWLVHGFSTRLGGVSELASGANREANSGKELNLGFTEEDSRERVLANRRKYFQALGAGKMRPIALRQIHSDIVQVVDSSKAALADVAPQGDALITRERGVLLCVQTADCIPILLADTKHRAVAAIHSGWRGTVRRIAEKTLGRMQMEFGTRPSDVIAAIGPGIARCCYEVGHEVVKEFAAKFPDAREWFDGPFDALSDGDHDPNWLPWLTMKPPGHAPPAPRVQLDLVAANRAILAGAGIPPARIVSSGYCTRCRTDLFFSYRLERATGRLMAAIGVR
ncbi:MAG: peptidoglycan editing factor PgeF [Candidatus Acidiferrales bacterium]